MPPDPISCPAPRSNPPQPVLEQGGSLINGALIRGADPQTGYLTLTGARAGPA